MITKEEIETLRKRASDVNNKIISLNARKELAHKEIKEILKELGYDPEMPLDEVQTLVEELIKKETDSYNEYKEKVDNSEKLIESLNID